MTDLPRSPRYNATSLARALTILDLFEPATPSLSATQIARRLRVRPGSLYPALSTLERLGYRERRTAKTITSLRRLEVETAGVLTRGYAVDDEELHEGVMCIAAPVRDHAGEVVAAISVSVLKARVTEARVEKIAQEVVRTAAIISGEMRYRSA
jgi:DNA-binding IclR family transcriptional regulator